MFILSCNRVVPKWLQSKIISRDTNYVVTREEAAIEMAMKLVNRGEFLAEINE